MKADGSGDHQLWTHSDAQPKLGIEDLAWSPDGQDLVFSSGHASAASLFHSDLYIIKQDSTGFRKLTNSPDRSLYSKYPKGNVNVTVRNNSYTFQTSNATAGVFFVYVAGAEAPQQVTVPPGTSKTVSFKSVADFGDKAQAIVAIYGSYRWFEAGTDVKAGQSVKAPDLNISGDGIEYLGPFDRCGKAMALRFVIEREYVLWKESRSIPLWVNFSLIPCLVENFPSVLVPLTGDRPLIYQINSFILKIQASPLSIKSPKAGPTQA